MIARNLEATIEKKCAITPNKAFVEVYEWVTHNYQLCIDQNGNNFNGNNGNNWRKSKTSCVRTVVI